MDILGRPTIDKNYFVYGITPQGFSDNEVEVNETLKNLQEDTWGINSIVGAGEGDILVIKCGEDKRGCVKNNECEKLEKGIYAIAKIQEIIDEGEKSVKFKVIENFYGNLPKNNSEILKLTGFGLQNRGLAKIKDKDKFLELLLES